MTKKQTRKRKQRPSMIDGVKINRGAKILYKHIGPTHVGSAGSAGSGAAGNLKAVPLQPAWFGIGDLRPDVAGMYLIIGHEGKAVGGRMIQTVYAPNQMIAHFEDMSGERIGLHCIKSVYGPIPEENPNG